MSPLALKGTQMIAILLAAAAAATPAPAADSAVSGMQPAPGVPSLLASGVPALPDDLKARVMQYSNARSANVVDVADDGRALLITTRFANSNQVHVVEGPLGARTQLTFADEPINTARFQPGDNQIVWFLRDKGGGEFFQVYRLDRRTGRSELVTDGKSRHEALAISRDGTRIAWAGTGRNGKDTDVYVGETGRAREAKCVTEREGTWQPLDFSFDGKKLLIQQFRSAEDSDLYLFDVQSGGLTQLTPKDTKANVATALFSADGKAVYLVTDRYSDFNQLYRIDLGAPPQAKPTPIHVQDRWNVEELAVAPDGNSLAVALNEDGISRMYLVDPRGRRPPRPLALPDTAVLANARFARKAPSVLALTFETATAPKDAYVLDVKAPQAVRWTRSEVGGIDPSTFVGAELVRYPSKDGVTVPAFLFKPRQAAAKTPVIVIWHGGPEGQSRPTFSTFIQLLAAEMGIAVLMPNVRGSEGYGKAYLAMDNGPKREQSLADIGATLDFIGSRPDLDAGRIGVYGGSYGGYMTLATVAFFGKRVRAAVDVVGISNLVTFLQNTQAYRRDLRRAEYGDERDPAVRAVQERISPLNSVDKIEAELMVVQGKNDPRVPQSEAEQIVQAVRKRGKDVWYVLGLNEGHGFQKKENKDFSNGAIALFFQQKLLPQPVQ